MSFSVEMSISGGGGGAGAATSAAGVSTEEAMKDLEMKLAEAATKFKNAQSVYNSVCEELRPLRAASDAAEEEVQRLMEAKASMNEICAANQAYIAALYVFDLKYDDLNKAFAAERAAERNVLNAKMAIRKVLGIASHKMLCSCRICGERVDLEL